MNAYETVTARLIEKLGKGIIPWRQPWKNTRRGASLPTNYITGRAYRGINCAVLLCSGYDAPQWLTYKQAQTIGAQVRKGERGTPVVFWQFPGRTSEDAEETSAPWCKSYTVFNISQCDGIPIELPFDAEPFDAIAASQGIMDGYMAGASHPHLVHGGSSACYMPSPAPQSFVSPERYYCTAFHEFAHSTGHKARLSRDLTEKFGTKAYAYEELVAEFTAAFLCAESGISSEGLDAQNAAYIANWLATFKADSRIAVTAAQRAQKAADYILQRQAAAIVETAVAA